MIEEFLCSTERPPKTLLSEKEVVNIDNEHYVYNKTHKIHYHLFSTDSLEEL